MLGAREVVSDSSTAEILLAAADCFMERGYTATSVDDVARRLGATKGRIYHHFPSKADLFAGVFEYGMDLICVVIEPYRNMPGPAAERWTQLALAHTKHMMRAKTLARVVWEGVEMHLRGARTPEQRLVLDGLVKYRNSYSNIFRETIVQAREEGDFHFEDPAITVQSMFMALNAPIFWYVPRPGEDEENIESIARQVVTFVYRGLTGKGELDL
ncbi:MAG: TetR/AcrR family transcriptional regulator [Rhizobiaceae bacterium]|jgi:AcrR family transcriptional regulator